jgi:hypothetical protein
MDSPNESADLDFLVGRPVSSTDTPKITLYG